jgi:hypothetical protein
MPDLPVRCGADTGADENVAQFNVAQFLRDYTAGFREFIVRVLTVLPRQA